jgi:hypothetical protein
VKRLFVIALVLSAYPTPANAAPIEPIAEPAAAPKGVSTTTPSPDLADTVVSDDFRVDSAGDGTIGATVGQPGATRSPGPVSISGRGPRCTHRPATYGEFPNVVDTNSGTVPDPNEQANRDVNGRTERGWVRVCPTGNNTGNNTESNSFYWAPANTDPATLIPDALADARTRLATPTPAINPDATAGGIVNLGMWLAVDDPGTTTARATLAGVWAQVTATISNITIDLGNGDTIHCDGIGTPIPDTALDSLDEGPCGYTYRQSSPDDDPYQLTITTNYNINWTTSNNQTGTLAPISRSITLDYDVDEIQTIGVSN